MSTPLFARRLAALLFIALSISADCAPPAGYYDSAQGKTGVELRQALHAIIMNATAIPYRSDTRLDTLNALNALDEDPANTNNVILVYSGWSDAKTNYGLSGWTKEHLWPE